MFKNAMEYYELPEGVELVSKEARDKALGGTDIAALFAEKIGLKYKTPLMVFYEKTGRKIDQSNQFTRRGLERENKIKEFVLVQLGLDVMDFNEGIGGEKSLRFIKKPHLIASLDGLVVKDKKLHVLEIKTCNRWTKKKWFNAAGEEEVPKNYYLQVMWYLHVSGLKKAIIVCEIDSWDCVDESRRCSEEERYEYLLREVEYDAKMGSFLEAAADRFWIEHVLNMLPPKPLGYDCEKPYLNAFNENVLGVGVITDELANKLQFLESRKKVLKVIEEEVKELEEDIKKEIYECEIMEGNGYKVSYKQHVRTTVDSTKLKELYPEVWDVVKKEYNSRVLKITREEE